MRYTVYIRFQSKLMAKCQSREFFIYHFLIENFDNSKLDLQHGQLSIVYIQHDHNGKKNTIMIQKARVEMTLAYA